MKKFIIYFLFIFSASFSFAAPEAPYAHLVEYNEINKNFFEKLISGKEATYKICTQEDDSKQYISDKKANTMFMNAISNWLYRTRYYISKNKAEEKFSDILKITNGQHNLRQVPCSDTAKTDLTIKYTENHSLCEEGAKGCIELSEGIIYININGWNKDYEDTLTHELGHAFGLADQYHGAIYKGSFLYNSKVFRPTIMNYSTKVTCDDVDGFISSIDRLKGTHREFYSLCKDGLFIKDGQGIIKTKETYDFEEYFYEFNAKVKVSYPEGLEDAYIVDMTLDKFILDETGIDILTQMGFEISDLKSLKHAVVKIHGMVLEKDSKDISYKEVKQPIGLWSLVLYEKKFLQINEKQIIMKDFFDGSLVIKFEDLEKGTVSFLNKDIKIPFINLYDADNKKSLRISNIFHLNLDRVNKDIDKNNYSNKFIENIGNTELSPEVLNLGL